MLRALAMGVDRPPPYYPKRMATANPAPHLDRQAVVAAARNLVETRGAKALTMQQLADELGVSAMAAYRHVANKSEILLLVANDLLSRVEIPDPDSGPWAERLRLVETAAFVELSRAPDLWSVIPPDAVFDEQERLSAAVTDILLDAGFDPGTASLAYEAIFSYVIGQLRLELHLDTNRHETSEDFVGTTESSVLLGAGVTAPGPETIDFMSYFDYGLRLMLSGLLADLERQRREAGEL